MGNSHASRKIFEKLDTNHKGTLSLQEFMNTPELSHQCSLCTLYFVRILSIFSSSSSNCPHLFVNAANSNCLRCKKQQSCCNILTLHPYNEHIYR